MLTHWSLNEGETLVKEGVDWPLPTGGRLMHDI